jgi:predicted HTH domain antitoxin
MTLTLEVPTATGSEDAEQQEKRIRAAVALYDARMISQGMGAELAGLSRAEFIEALGRAGVPVVQYSAEEAFAEARRQ